MMLLFLFYLFHELFGMLAVQARFLGKEITVTFFIEALFKFASSM